jgi:hypothetical protein
MVVDSMIQSNLESADRRPSRKELKMKLIKLKKKKEKREEE